MATAVQIQITLDDKGIVEGVQRIGNEFDKLGPRLVNSSTRSNAVLDQMASTANSAAEQFRRTSQASSGLNSTLGLDSGRRGNVVLEQMGRNAQSSSEQLRRANEATMLLSNTLGVTLPPSLNKVIARSQLLGPLLTGAFDVAVVAGFASAVMSVIPEIVRLTEVAAGYDQTLKDIQRDAVKASQAAFVNPATLDDAIKRTDELRERIDADNKIIEQYKQQSAFSKGILHEGFDTALKASNDREQAEKDLISVLSQRNDLQKQANEGGGSTEASALGTAVDLGLPAFTSATPEFAAAGALPAIPTIAGGSVGAITAASSTLGESLPGSPTPIVAPSAGLGVAAGRTLGIGTSTGLGARLGGLATQLGPIAGLLLGSKIGGTAGSLGAGLLGLAAASHFGSSGANAILGALPGPLAALAGGIGGGLLGFGIGSQHGTLAGALAGGGAGVLGTALILGAAAGPIGLAVGGLIGLVGGLFGGLFGGAKRRHQAEDYGPAIGKAEEDIRSLEGERLRRGSLAFGAPQYASGVDFFDPAESPLQRMTAAGTAGLAWLHTGERVLTAAENRAFTSTLQPSFALQPPSALLASAFSPAPQTRLSTPQQIHIHATVKAIDSKDVAQWFRTGDVARQVRIAIASDKRWGP